MRGPRSGDVHKAYPNVIAVIILAVVFLAWREAGRRLGVKHAVPPQAATGL